jgi:hypothetical protein
MTVTVREGKGGAAVKERLSSLVYKLTNDVVERRCKGAIKRARNEGREWDGKGMRKKRE